MAPVFIMTVEFKSNGSKYMCSLIYYTLVGEEQLVDEAAREECKWGKLIRTPDPLR